MKINSVFQTAFFVLILLFLCSCAESECKKTEYENNKKLVEKSVEEFINKRAEPCRTQRMGDIISACYGFGERGCGLGFEYCNYFDSSAREYFTGIFGNESIELSLRNIGINDGSERMLYRFNPIQHCKDEIKSSSQIIHRNNVITFTLRLCPQSKC